LPLLKKSWQFDKLTVRASRYYALLLLMVYGSAALSLWLSAVPMHFKILAYVIWILSAYISWRQWQKMACWQIYEQPFAKEAPWILENGRQAFSCQIRLFFEWPFLVVLDFVDVHNGKKNRLIIFADALSNDDFRRLRVRLRHSSKTKTSSPINDVH
jgi:hypothetical protein